MCKQLFVFSATGAQSSLQVSVRFTRGAHLLHLFPAHVFANANAGVVRDVIIRCVPLPSTTSAIRFAAPNTHACDETGQQHLNGRILTFLFVSVRQRHHRTSFIHCSSLPPAQALPMPSDSIAARSARIISSSSNCVVTPVSLSVL